MGRGITQPTLERRADARTAALDGNDPWPHLPGRIVSHVLRMAALELGHPVPFVVLSEADDTPRRHA